MTRNLVIDCHADTLLKKYYSFLSMLFPFDNFDFHVSKPLLIEGGVDVQVFAIFIPPRVEKLGIEITLNMIAMAKEMVKDGEFILIKSNNDLKRIENQKDALGMILSLEGAVVFERNLKLLPIFYELGIRSIALAWSRKNLFAEGTIFEIKNYEGEGLTVYGKQLVEQMENLGMVVDVSHLNKKSFGDVTQITTKPFIASHSNSFKLCPIKRNLTDEQLMSIASAEGVVGVNFCMPFLNPNPEKATINDVIQHIKHIIEVAGVDYVGLGSDFDGIKKGPEGLEHVGKMKKIPPLLEKEGFSRQDINKIMGGNFQRVFKTIWH
ncbi:MAG: dipeptidase [Candidatus Hodarchaeota archaeon]